MPYTQNSETAIYYEVEGTGPPLLMAHGLLHDHKEIIDAGYLDALRQNRQIILFDMRGHGKSDKPHDPLRYSDNDFVGDIAAILDTLDIEKADIFGYSFGGGVAFKCALHIPERVRSLIVGGGGAEKPPPSVYHGLMQYCHKQKDSKKSGNDWEALIALCEASLVAPSLMNAVPGIVCPVHLFIGDKDPGLVSAKKTDRLLPDSALTVLSGLNHVQTLNRADLVVPVILDSLARIDRKKKEPPLPAAPSILQTKTPTALCTPVPRYHTPRYPSRTPL